MERVEASYTPKYQRFLVKERRFTQQFSHLYTKRLESMRSVVTAAACARWGLDVSELSNKIIDMRVGDTAVVVGTLYKEMQLKPNVLSEFSAKVQQGPAPVRANYCSPDDELVVEDESGRVVLHNVGELKHAVVTGVVVAVKGCVSASGGFVLEDLCTAGIPAAKPLVPPTSPVVASATSARYVLLVSGLNLGSPTLNPLPLLMLTEFVQGCLGAEVDTETVSGIVRVVVCGGIVDQPSKNFGDKTLSRAEQEALAAPLETGDLMLSQLAAAVAVDVMPGETDPSNYTLPQQPLHRCLLPLSARYTTFRPVTNPYDAEVDGVRLLGSSGQAVADVLRHTSTPLALAAKRDATASATGAGAGASATGGGDPDGDVDGAVGPPGAAATSATSAWPPEGADGATPRGGASASASPAVDVLEKTLSWRHMAPTAPDTLACYPFYEHDPLVIGDGPHVYFTGNHTQFETKHVDAEHGPGTRLIAVPSFATTGCAVMVNLSTLACLPLQFNADAAELK